MITWMLVVPIVAQLHAMRGVPQIDAAIQMPSQEVCEQIRDLNTPGPDGVPGPQCWPIEKK